MCKNLGNVGYFQKSKKMVLSLVGAGLLLESAVAFGWVSVGSISGYDVKYRRFARGSDYVYQIIGTSTIDGSQLGFGCFCANNSTKLTWQGGVNSSCDAANPNTPVKLDDPIMGSYSIAGVPIPGGACCKSVPRVGTTNIPGLPPCG